ncbi:MAG: family 10 glycosylhydrolase [Kiritimatiellae bacterium]|nr:family 10 glycosylhydrolase [Kiritimatiellia bacterium]
MKHHHRPAARRVAAAMCPHLQRAFLIAATCAITGCRLTQPPCPPAGDESPIILNPVELDWQPHAGAAPPLKLTDAEQPAAVFRCPFDSLRGERVYWDADLRLDLSACTALRVPVRVSSPNPIEGVSLYFRSGPGWYHLTLRLPPATGIWRIVTVPLETAAAEGRPGGWSGIEALRFSVWRGGTTATDIAVGPVRAVGTLGRDILVAVLRPPATDDEQGESRFARQLAQETVEDLRTAGIPALAMEGEEGLERAGSRRVPVLAVPYYPDAPTGVVARLAALLESGTRLIIAYDVPPPLQQALGVGGGRYLRDDARRQFAEIRVTSRALPGAPPSLRQSSHNIRAFEPLEGRSQVLAEWWTADGRPASYAAIVGSSNGIVLGHVLFAADRTARARLWRAMVLGLAPEVGAAAVRLALSRPPEPDRVVSSGTTSSIRRMLPRNHPAQAELRIAEAKREAALRLAARGHHAEALEQLDDAHRHFARATAAAEPPTPLPFRAVWCHEAYGVRGRTWDEAIHHLATNGITAVLPNVCWGGVAFYPSEVLPVADEVRERGDALAECLAAARRYHLEVHAWRVNWNLGPAPRPFIERLRAEGRLQRGRGGAQRPWLCPSHPDNRRLEVEAMVEIARRYNVNGLHFDYIRYPDADHCVCDGCRARFEESTGRRVQNWPDDLWSDQWRSEWNEWRRRQISLVVEEVHRRARAARPGLKLSAAVFRNWERDRHGVAQDWKLWCERGWLDFVCPMNYTDDAVQFELLVRRQRAWAGAVPLCPGIGASAVSPRLTAMDVTEQIRIAERAGAAGFVVFNYGETEFEELIPMLGLGVLRPAR